MLDYLWTFTGFGPTVGVTKEERGSIFYDKSGAFHPWWNGGGIHVGCKTLAAAKKIALEYAKDYAIREREKAAQRIVDATVAIAKIDKELLVWQMDEVVRSGKELYSCVACGMALSEPCEHLLNSMSGEGDTHGDS